jgi:hypothetical protein
MGDPDYFNLRFVVARAKACEIGGNICVSEGSPMRLALPYLGIALCASLAAWMTAMLLY